MGLSDDCEHDLVSVEDQDLPSYCWFFRCRKCGAECGHPDELLHDSATPRTDAIENEPTPSGADWSWRRDRYKEFSRQLERELLDSIKEECKRERDLHEMRVQYVNSRREMAELYSKVSRMRNLLNRAAAWLPEDHAIQSEIAGITRASIKS